MSETETVLHVHTKVCPATAAGKNTWLGKKVVHCAETTKTRKA